MRSYQITVAPAATVIADATKGGGPRVTISVPSAALSGIYIGGDENQSANPARISGTGNTLSSTTGFLLTPGAAPVTFVLEGNEALYGISVFTTVSTVTHVMRTNARYG